MADHTCDQIERLKYIEGELVNHKTWRKETTAALNDNNVLLATIDERQKSIVLLLEAKVKRFDDHVDTGKGFRAGLVGTACVLLLAIVSGGVAYGMMRNQVTTNTDRWNRLLEKHPIVLEH
jgi:hypothetical protein